MRKYIWYIATVHPSANEAIGKALGEAVEESKVLGVVCADGVRRDLWRCPKRFVETIWNDERLGQLVQVFRKLSPEGKSPRLVSRKQVPEAFSEQSIDALIARGIIQRGTANLKRPRRLSGL